MDKSHLTAKTRSRPSAPMKYIENMLGQIDDSEFTGLKFRMLDYGCGKGQDADHYGLEKYDPYYFPTRPVGKFYFIFCNYVLNVVSVEEEKKIIDDILSLLSDGGKAFVSVRRDVKEDGFTDKGTYQRNVVLSYPVVYENKGHYCIYLLKNTTN